MGHSLTQIEIQQFLDHFLYGIPLDFDDLQTWVMMAENWSCSLGIITYIYLRIIEKKSKESEIDDYINVLHDLEQRLFLDIEEINYAFIDLLLKTIRDPSLSIDDCLLFLHNDMLNHEYGHIIRY